MGTFWPCVMRCCRGGRGFAGAACTPARRCTTMQPPLARTQPATRQGVSASERGEHSYICTLRAWSVGQILTQSLIKIKVASLSFSLSRSVENTRAALGRRIYYIRESANFRCKHFCVAAWEESFLAAALPQRLMFVLSYIRCVASANR